MSQLRTNAILDASGGTTATVNGIPLRPGVLDPENRIINGAFDFQAARLRHRAKPLAQETPSGRTTLRSFSGRRSAVSRLRLITL